MADNWIEHAREAFVGHFGPQERYYPPDGDQEKIELAVDWYLSRWGAWTVAWQNALDFYGIDRQTGEGR